MINKAKIKEICNTLIKYKYTRPFLYSILISIFIYLLISNIVIRKELKDLDKPHFTISSITKNFLNVEYMHMLLTIQEITENTSLRGDLVRFVNASFPNHCPAMLKKQLNLMNWEAQAFLIRVKRLFELLEIYEHIERIDESIASLEEQSKRSNDYSIFNAQIDVLVADKNNILSSKITNDEYEFIREYYGIALRLRKD